MLRPESIGMNSEALLPPATMSIRRQVLLCVGLAACYCRVGGEQRLEHCHQVCGRLAPLAPAQLLVFGRCGWRVSVRAGDQPSDRPAPRGPRDVAQHAPRCPRQPAPTQRRRLPPDQPGLPGPAGDRPRRHQGPGRRQNQGALCSPSAAGRMYVMHTGYDRLDEGQSERAAGTVVRRCR